jgi:hypothetical protein
LLFDSHSISAIINNHNFSDYHYFEGDIKIESMQFSAIRDLFEVYDNSYGYTEEELQAQEQRLNIKLPAALRTYYAALGKHKEMNQTQDSLILPEQLHVDRNGRMVFYTENQFAAVWGILLTDMEQDDPPVYISYSDDNWQREGSTVSAFLTAMAHLQAIFAFRYSANSTGVDEAVIKVVEQHWKKLEGTLSIWQVTFYQNTNDEILALMQSPGQTDLFIAAKSAAQLVAMDALLQVDWDYHSLD